MGKQIKATYKDKNIVSTSTILELLHMYLFDISRYKLLNIRRHCFIIVDDHTRYIWVFFLKHND